MRFPVLTVAIWNKKLFSSQNWFQVRNPPPKTKQDYKDGFTIFEIPLDLERCGFDILGQWI